MLSGPTSKGSMIVCSKDLSCIAVKETSEGFSSAKLQKKHS